MKLFGSTKAQTARSRTASAGPTGSDPVCLQCGMIAAGTDATFCRRCGLPIGAAPRAEAELPTCPTCYATVDDDGRIPSLRQPTVRVDLVAHSFEHEQFPVGDDDYLESLRAGDMIRIAAMAGALRPGPALPRDGGDGRRTSASLRALGDRHGDVAAEALGTRRGDLRRSAGVAGRSPRGDGSHGALPPHVARRRLIPGRAYGEPVSPG